MQHLFTMTRQRDGLACGSFLMASNSRLRKETPARPGRNVPSRKALRARDLQTVDLVEITTATGRHRCLAQSAFMVGPLNGPLPDDCIVTRVFAPSAVFQAYAAQKPELTCESLFPGPAIDSVMAALLSIPWVTRETDGDGIGIDFFDRGLPPPESARFLT